MPYPLRAVCAAAITLLCPLAAPAQDVALRSFDGSVELEGDLISYDGAYYRLDTVYGPLTVSAEGVTCAGPGCPDLDSFVAEARIAGAATVAEGLLPALLDAFATAQGMMLVVQDDRAGALVYALHRADGGLAARFHVTPGRSDDGLLALLNGDTDLALSLRQPTDLERRADRAQAPDDPPLDRRVRVIGLDALVPVVSPDNPIDTVSLPMLASLFSGEIDNWADLGGPDAPVALHLLAPGLGLAQSLSDRLRLPEDDSLPVTRHTSAAGLADAVARDPYAIGITAQSARGLARVLPLTGACGLVQMATTDAVKAEDYPLTAPVFVYLAPQRLPQLLRDFLAFTETAAAERAVAASGFVNQTLTRTPLALQGHRLANAIAAGGEDIGLDDLQALVEAMRGTERLSATFRFAGGAADLDAQSRASAARLAAAIERGVFDGRRLVFAGFSDGEGSAEINERLALRRAEAVMASVQTLSGDAAPGRVTMEVAAFGEAMPMACDDSEWGRQVNRRVEVWLD